MSSAAIQRGCLPILELELLVASAFGVCGGKIVASGQIDHKSNLWWVFMVYVKFHHKLPDFMAAVTITINFMVLAALVGEKFDCIAKKSINTLVRT
jgi:hypothetical protein